MESSKKVTAATCACLLAGVAAQPLLPSPTVIALTAALNLECLEAEFYSWAAFDKPLDLSQRGDGEPSLGAPANYDPTTFSPWVYMMAREFANDEREHVLVVRKLIEGITGLELACPQVDVRPQVFAEFADDALSILENAPDKFDPPFSPYFSEEAFLLGAFVFDDLVVSAYRGLIPELMLEKDATRRGQIMHIIGGLIGTEGYHGGIIRDKIANATETSGVAGVALATIAEAFSGLRAAINGDVKDQGLFRDGEVNLVPADQLGLVFSRSVIEVLRILDIGGFSSPFFPQGIVAAPVEGRDYNVAKQCGIGLPRNSQCGAPGHSDCCIGNNVCTKINDMYSECRPAPIVPGIADWFEQCGGLNYNGPTTCEEHSKCMQKNQYYSHCVPDILFTNAAHEIKDVHHSAEQPLKCPGNETQVQPSPNSGAAPVMAHQPAVLESAAPRTVGQPEGATAQKKKQGAAPAIIGIAVALGVVSVVAAAALVAAIVYKKRKPASVEDLSPVAGESAMYSNASFIMGRNRRNERTNIATLENDNLPLSISALDSVDADIVLDAN